MLIRGSLLLAATVAAPRGQRHVRRPSRPIYKWVDENGIAHYTTTRSSIPRALRDRYGLHRGLPPPQRQPDAPRRHRPDATRRRLTAPRSRPPAERPSRRARAATRRRRQRRRSARGLPHDAPPPTAPPKQRPRPARSRTTTLAAAEPARQDVRDATIRRADAQRHAAHPAGFATRRPATPNEAQQTKPEFRDNSEAPADTLAELDSVSDEQRPESAVRRVQRRVRGRPSDCRSGDRTSTTLPRATPQDPA